MSKRKPGSQDVEGKWQSAYEFDDYKLAIKRRLRDLQRSKKSYTLRKLADRISIQHTYLSRCLNSDRSHLSEDQIYSLGRFLALLPEEIDFLILLRSLANSNDPHRREAISTKISSIRARKLANTDSVEFRYEDLQAETAYLFTPMAVVVHVALFIKEFQRNPRTLCSYLGITSDRLREVLRILDQSDYIVLSDSDSFEVLEVKSKYPHFGREHPLMRAHQSTLRTQMQSRLQQTSETEKESFMVTFSMDREGFEKVRNEFKQFIGRVQQASMEGKHKHVYQLGFDILRWF